MVQVLGWWGVRGEGGGVWPGPDGEIQTEKVQKNAAFYYDKTQHDSES